MRAPAARLSLKEAGCSPCEEVLQCLQGGDKMPAKMRPRGSGRGTGEGSVEQRPCLFLSSSSQSWAQAWVHWGSKPLCQAELLVASLYGTERDKTGEGRVSSLGKMKCLDAQIVPCGPR